MPRAISFDFWNTLYADGAEDKRRILRKEYFASIISSYRDLELGEIEQAFTAGSKFFLDNWINHSITPTAAERTRFMAKYLSVGLSEDHVGDLERTDVAGAINAGCTSIKFTGANHDIVEGGRAHHIVAKYEDLLKMLPG